jgi:hypothetical protein
LCAKICTKVVLGWRPKNAGKNHAPAGAPLIKKYWMLKTEKLLSKMDNKLVKHPKGKINCIAQRSENAEAHTKVRNPRTPPL